MAISANANLSPSINVTATVTGAIGDCPNLCELISGSTAEAIVGCLSPEQEAAIEGIICEIPDTAYLNSDGSTEATLANRTEVRLVNANIASVVNDTPNAGEANITVEVDIPVVNSNGDSMGANVDDLLNPYVIGDLTVDDDNGTLEFPMPTVLVIDGEIDTAVYNTVSGQGVLTITPQSSTPTALIYQRSGFRGFQASLVDYDLGWQVDAGTYNYGNGAGLRVSYGSGADRFYRVAPLNAFGNNLRYTDSVGGGATDNLAGWSTVDWSLRPTAIPYYVIDHLTGLGWVVAKIGFQETWDVALATAHNFSHGGFTDYRLPSTGEMEDVLNTAITIEYFGAGNIFFRSNHFVAGTDTSMWLNSYNIGNNTQANTLNNSGDIGRAARTATTGRATYAVRTHYS